MAKTKLTPGQRVQFKHCLVRSGDYSQSDRPPRMRWIPRPLEGEGILVGLRTLQNGYTTRESEYDEGYGSSSWNVWHQTSTTQAAMVVTSLYRRPIFVPREEIENA